MYRKQVTLDEKESVEYEFLCDKLGLKTNKQFHEKSMEILTWMRSEILAGREIASILTTQDGKTLVVDVNKNIKVKY